MEFVFGGVIPVCLCVELVASFIPGVVLSCLIGSLFPFSSFSYFRFFETSFPLLLFQKLGTCGGFFLAEFFVEASTTPRAPTSSKPPTFSQGPAELPRLLAFEPL